jgi:hypothetical protein
LPSIRSAPQVQQRHEELVLACRGLVRGASDEAASRTSSASANSRRASSQSPRVPGVEALVLQDVVERQRVVVVARDAYARARYASASSALLEAGLADDAQHDGLAMVVTELLRQLECLAVRCERGLVVARWRRWVLPSLPNSRCAVIRSPASFAAATAPS